MGTNRWYLMAWPAFACAVLSVSAQEGPPPAEKESQPAPPRQERPEEAITITGTRIEERAFDIPQKIETVTPQELAERQPRTPAEALRDEPGIWVQKTGHGGGAPIVRGHIGNQVLYLIDGVRVNNGRLFAGPNPFFNQMDLGAIERIEVLKGPGAVQYGSDAIGGVIHVITKSANLFPEKPELHATVRSYYGTADSERRGSLDWLYAQGPVNVNLGATLAEIDDVRGGRGLGTLDPSDWREAHYFAKTNFKLSEHQTLRLSYLNTLREDVSRFDQSKRNPSGRPRFFTPWEDRDLLQATYQAVRLGGWIDDIRAYAYYQPFHGKSDFSTENATFITRTRTEEDQRMMGVGVQFASPLASNVRLIYGTDFRHELLEEERRRFQTNKNTGVTTVSTPQGQTPDGTYDVNDMFVLAEWNVTEALTLSVGARFETVLLNSDPAPEDPPAGFTQDDLDIFERYNALTGSFGAVYSLTENLNLTATVARGFRAPTYADTLSTGPFTFGVSIPSPNVDPEYSVSYELGARALFEDWSAGVAGFYTSLTDLLDSAPTGGFVDLNGNGSQDPGEAAFARQNMGAAYVMGVEAHAQVALFSDWTVFGNLAWTYGKDTENDDPLRFIPPLNGVLGVRWAPGDWWIEGSARMAAAHTRVNPDDESDPARARDPSRTFPAADNPPLRSDFSIPGYTVFNIRAGVRLSESLSLTVAVENVFDRRYREAFSRMDAPGLNVIAGVETRY